MTATGTVERSTAVDRGRSGPGSIARRMISDRTRSTWFWLTGTSLLTALMAAFYPSIRDSGQAMEDYMNSLPEGLQKAFGLNEGASISSPEGYLVSQLHSNMYPVILLILGLGIAAWIVAGSEADGTLEVVLANPVSRARVAWERCTGGALIVAVVTFGSTAVLAALSPMFGLDEGIPWWGLWGGALQVWAFVMVISALGFAVGAATGSKGLAIAVGAAAAVVGFFLQALAPMVEALGPLRWGSPWFWMLRDNPVTTAPGLLSLALPLGLALVFVAAGVWVFDRRDLKL